MEHGQLFLDFMTLGVNAVVSHDFGVGCLVIQLICGFGEGVELVAG